MTTTSITFNLSVVSSGGVPAWAQDLVPNAFNYIAGTQFASWGDANIAGGPFLGADPITAIVDSFNDPAYDETTGNWYFFGGGHGDSSCNPVVRCQPRNDFAYSVTIPATPASVYLPEYMTSWPIYYPSGVLFGPNGQPGGAGVWFLTVAEGLDPTLDAGYIAPQLARVSSHMYGAAAIRNGVVHYFYLTYGEANTVTGQWGGRGTDIGAQLNAIFSEYGTDAGQVWTRAIYDDVTDRFFVSMPNSGWRNGFYVFDPSSRQVTSVHDCPFGPMLQDTPTVKIGRKLYCFRLVQPSGYTGPQNLNQGFICDMDQMAAATGHNTMVASAFVLAGDTDGTIYQPSTYQETIPCYWDGVAIRRWNYETAHIQYIYSVDITPTSGTGTADDPLVLQQTQMTLAGTPPTSVQFIYTRLAYDAVVGAAICIPSATSNWFALKLT